MFKITPDFSKKQQGKGFQITFSNGVTLSVQFGFGNYCNNRNGDMFDVQGQTASKTAEIALFDKEGNWITKEALVATGINFDPDDDVEGYVTPDQIALLMAWGVMYGRNQRQQVLAEVN